MAFLTASASLLAILLAMLAPAGTVATVPPIQAPPVVQALQELQNHKNTSWYPQLTEIPDGGSFSCDTVNQPGYYADVEFACQVTRRCTVNNTLVSYLCPIQTIFNQITLTCDWFNNVDCLQSVRFYDYSNSRLYHANWPLLSDFSEDYYKQLAQRLARDYLLAGTIAAAYASQGGNSSTPGPYLALLLQLNRDHRIPEIPGLTGAQCLVEDSAFVASVTALFFYGNVTANLDADACPVGEEYYQCVVERTGAAFTEVNRVTSDPTVQSAPNPSPYLTVLLNIHSELTLVAGVVSAANPDLAGQACLAAQPQLAANYAALQNTLLT